MQHQTITGEDVVGYLEDLSRVMLTVAQQPLADALKLLMEARASGHRVYVMGNGGSAAIASQFVCNFAKTAQADGGRPIRAFALTDNTPALTAWANDTEYAQIFANQVRALAEPGDVVMVISASGNSPNVVEALTAARDLGAHTVGLLGFDGGRCLGLADVVIHVPSNSYGLVEDTHMAVGHALTTALRLHGDED